ncbi:nucleoside kinase [Heliophilum fasciatum]|uniref:Uridine kinase n=1 Tax=Heliophilum fasciatum TaxID=35700 RepID=A0A4R2RV19_9FIRM|nr:nucleoside kinase [Heliophilum fasciatum]MCW2277131.1 uridine kinase [Heliophilum fasciatum]TCP68232.1 uridine kinase [Heliophilum fasciatum]
MDGHRPYIGLTIITPQGNDYCRWWNRRTPLQVLANELQAQYRAPIVALSVNNQLEDLRYTPDEDCTVEMVDMTKEAGLRVYARSLAFVLMRTARELFPERQLEIQFSLNKGFYSELLGDEPLTDEMVNRLRERMWDTIRAAEPIERSVVSREKAMEILVGAGRQEQAELLRYRTSKEVNLYRCGEFIDFSDEILVPHTGLITCYQMLKHYTGILLRHPDSNDAGTLPANVEQKKLSYIFLESDKWAKIVKVHNVFELNKYSERGDAGEVIRIAEALHEKKIAQIADRIADHPEQARLILIAGPSSSGKTTFAQRLKIQLRVNGLSPVTIALDDYFFSRDQTPRDQNGEYDFEHIDAIDRQLFNEHLTKLIAGEAVDIPFFNFHTGQREYREGRKVQIQSNQPIIIEGIHGLNEALTERVERSQKFKIYVSALLQVNLDLMNYIKSTDARAIRRITRDSKFRSYPAERTLAIWPSVRRGEERWIFPYQEEADIMFNSALVYEPAVIKTYAEPLLRAIPKQSRVYGEAQRLLSLLDYFCVIDDQEIAPNSILREFIGGSCFAK